MLYKPVRTNTNADGLSRKLAKVNVTSGSSSEEVEAFAVEVSGSDVIENIL